MLLIIFRFGVHCTFVSEQVGPGLSSFFHLPAQCVPYPSRSSNGRCSLKMRTSVRLERFQRERFLDREWLQKEHARKKKERGSFTRLYVYKIKIIINK